MKKYDVLALGELNVDLILNRIDGEPEIGKEKFAKDMTLTLGSSTAIFAANAAALGVKVGFVGMIGNDAFGALVKNSLAAKGVDTELLIETDQHATGATIVMNYDEDRANITYQGAMDVMSFADIDKAVFDQAKHVHISSVFMQSGVHRDLIDILTCAREKGVTTSLDTQWDPAETWLLDYKAVLPLVSVFLPNEKELKLLTSSETLQEAIDKIRPYINVCIIKQGSKGSLLLTKDAAADNFCPSFLNKQVVDAIGAGDSFNSGFVSQFVQGKSLTECQRFGNLTGALNTTAAGGTGAFTSMKNIRRVAKERFGFDM